MNSIPFRKIKQNIETQYHIYSEYEWMKNLRPNIILMCSGGVDSMFLLDLMSRCDIRFDVAHFIHGIRSPDESMKDLHLIHNTVANCNKSRDKDNQITVRVGYGAGLDVGKNIEARAHEQRWSFIDKIASEVSKEYYESDYVKNKRMETTNPYVEYEIHERTPAVLAITGHHYNDQIEQVFLRLMRGDSHDSLTMNNKQRMGNVHRYRPLLEVPKTEIVKQAVKRNLVWNEDYTNGENDADRNWLRNYIIPQLMERRNIETSMFESIKRATLS